jgi:competence protein ComEA
MKTVALAVAALLSTLATLSAQAQTAPQTAPARPPASSTAPPTTAPAQGALIGINSASKEELQTLTGIGPARADAIVKRRPYKGKDELHRKDIIPESVYEGIRDKIIARQS